MTFWTKKIGSDLAKIRTAELSDLPQIKGLYHYYIREYSKGKDHFLEYKEYKCIEQIKCGPFLVCEIGNKIIGFKNSYATLIYEDYWSKGIGTALWALYIYTSKGSGWDAFIHYVNEKATKKMLYKLSTNLNLQINFLLCGVVCLKMDEGTKEQLDERIENFLQKEHWKKQQ